MRKENNWIICPCCGKKLEIKTMRSVYVPDYGMDQKPSLERALPEIYHCETCNFCGVNVCEADNNILQVIVSSDYYQNIWKSVDKDVHEKEYLSAIHVANSPRLAADLYMCFCWYLEFHGKKAEADRARTKAVDLQSILLEEGKNVDIMLQKTDSLRQLGRFDEALEMIDEIKQLVNIKDHPFVMKLLIVEKKLILSEDIEPHFQSEIG